MKKITTLALSFALFNVCFSQGWLGNGTNLYTVNPPGKSTLNVGVNTTNPTAKFHVNGTVRLQGLAKNNSLTQFLAVDSSGNLALKDISTVGNAWLLSGNSSTNPSTNFIGTRDNQRLVFKTNSIERMTLLTNSHVGINNSNPASLLSINGVNTGENAEIFVTQTAGSQLGAYLTLDNRLNGGKYWSIGSTGTLNSPMVNGALEFYEFGFGTRMILDAQGRLGVAIGNGKVPTANLHTKGSVRFEGLPSGTGNVLVVDANGNLAIGTASSFQASAATADASSQLTDLKKVLTLMQNQVDNLSRQVNELKSSNLRSASTTIKTDELKVSPNPSNGNTTIEYSIGNATKTYYIKVYDLNGKILKSYALPKNQSKGSLNFSASELVSGVYGVSLTSQNDVVQNKFLIVD